MKHLELLNVALALRFRQPGWPPLLAEAEYLVDRVGVGFRLGDGTMLSPDIVATCRPRSVTLLTEIKGGANLDVGQLGRMERVTPEDLRDFAHLSIANPQTHRIGIVYLCNEEHFDAIVVASTGRRATIIGFDGRRFHLGGAPLVDGQLGAAFAQARVEEGVPPLDLFPFDKESDLPTVARSVIPEVVARLIEGAGLFSVDEVFKGTHATVYGPMQSTGSGAEADPIKRRITALLTEAARGEFSTWIEQVPHQTLWRFRSSLPFDQAARTRELKAIQRAATTLIERLGGGRADQLDLFDNLPDG